MIKPISLIRQLNSLIGQHYEIDYVNLSPIAMRGMTSLLKRTRMYEIKFFDEYILVYLHAKPVIIKSVGWRSYGGNYDLFYDEKTNTMYNDIIIKFK